MIYITVDTGDIKYVSATSSGIVNKLYSVIKYYNYKCKCSVFDMVIGTIK